MFHILRNLSLQSWVLCDLHLLLLATWGNSKLKKIIVGLECLVESSQWVNVLLNWRTSLCGQKSKRSYGGSSWGNTNHHARLNSEEKVVPSNEHILGLLIMFNRAKNLGQWVGDLSNLFKYINTPTMRSLEGTTFSSEFSPDMVVHVCNTRYL